jgi:hypothetical protein
VGGIPKGENWPDLPGQRFIDHEIVTTLDVTLPTTIVSHADELVE